MAAAVTASLRPFARLPLSLTWRESVAAKAASKRAAPANRLRPLICELQNRASDPVETLFKRIKLIESTTSYSAQFVFVGIISVGPSTYLVVIHEVKRCRWS